MESSTVEFLSVFFLFAFALFIYERYLYLTSLSALVVRDRAVKLILKARKNDAISPELLDFAEEAVADVLATNYIVTIVKTVMTHQDENAHDDKLNEEEKAFVKAFSAEILKANAVGHLFSYTLVLTVFVLLLSVSLFVVLLAGKMRKAGRFFDNMIDNIGSGNIMRPSF